MKMYKIARGSPRSKSILKTSIPASERGPDFHCNPCLGMIAMDDAMSDIKAGIKFWKTITGTGGAHSGSSPEYLSRIG